MSVKTKKIIPLVVVILIAIPLLTACGGGTPKINVTLDSYTIQMPSTISAGQVTFHVTNADASANHEFVIFKTDLAADKLPIDKSTGGVDETASSLTHIGEVSDMVPGDVKDLTVTLDPGNYVAICNLPGHYQSGMYTGFTVK